MAGESKQRQNGWPFRRCLAKQARLSGRGTRRLGRGASQVETESWASSLCLGEHYSVVQSAETNSDCIQDPSFALVCLSVCLSGRW